MMTNPATCAPAFADIGVHQVGRVPAVKMLVLSRVVTSDYMPATAGKQRLHQESKRPTKLSVRQRGLSCIWGDQGRLEQVGEDGPRRNKTTAFIAQDGHWFAQAPRLTAGYKTTCRVHL